MTWAIIAVLAALALGLCIGCCLGYSGAYDDGVEDTVFAFKARATGMTNEEFYQAWLHKHGRDEEKS